MFRSLPAAQLAAMIIGLSFLAQPSALKAEEVLGQGSFTGKSGHVTSGGVAVVKEGAGHRVVLRSNFNFDGAPDPKVGLGRNGSYDPAAKLSHLKSNSGEQTYEIPASIDPARYNQVYIWCEKYSVPLGVATLQ